MQKSLKLDKKDYVFILILFAISFTIRCIFFQGFVLCDDPEEFGNPKYFLENKPQFNYHFHFRFTIWGINWLFFKILGVSELSFFLPTLIMSSIIPIFGFLILRKYNYSPLNSFLSSLMIATAPFEVMIGTLRANDLIFAWFVYLAFLFFILFKDRPKIQGTLVGISLWFAFYAKMWAIYFYLIFLFFYLYTTKKIRKCEGLLFFILTTAVLHVSIGILWIKLSGIFFPFFKYHSATYPVKVEDLFNVWLIYPTYIFKGSYIGTTLFGVIPYLLIISLFLKFVIKIIDKKTILDELDIFLFLLYSIFFLLLNFIPDTPLKFDQYYSVPRIFRYLYPISFPITLHLAKNLVDILFRFRVRNIIIITIFTIIIFINMVQANEATMPGRLYRQNLLSIVDDIKKFNPPSVLIDSWIGYFLTEVYLKNSNIHVEPIYGIYDAKEYEKWLRENENELPNGTIMVANFGSCVHYGCYNCGFQLNLFQENLTENWELLKEYEYLEFSKQRPALWILKRK